jgi:hypothetical protein
MLDSLRKWFTSRGTRAGDGEWSELSQWAESRRHVFRHVRQAQGFVVDGRLGTTAWRLEWGPSQRTYIQGGELRMRAELPVAPDLQALILTRALQESMEKDVFDQYVEGVQTRVDTQTPPEMRWLVMYPVLTGHELKGLRDSWAAVANFKPWLMSWLSGALAADLATRQTDTQAPAVLMVARGRLILRASVPDPEPQVLESWQRLFEIAIRECLRVQDESLEPSSATTMPSMWAASALPKEAAATAAH